MGYIIKTMKNFLLGLVLMTACGGGEFTAADGAGGGGGGGGSTTSANSTGTGGTTGNGGATDATSTGTGGAGTTTTSTGACIPTTCEDADVGCGLLDDGCGNAIDCGPYDRAELCDAFQEPSYNCHCPVDHPYGWTCETGVSASGPPFGNCVVNPNGARFGWCCEAQP